MVYSLKTETDSTSEDAVHLRSIPGAQFFPAQDLYRLWIGTGVGSAHVVNSGPTYSSSIPAPGQETPAWNYSSESNTDLSNSHASPFPSPGIDA